MGAEVELLPPDLLHLPVHLLRTDSHHLHQLVNPHQHQTGNLLLHQLVNLHLRQTGHQILIHRQHQTDHLVHMVEVVQWEEVPVQAVVAEEDADGRSLGPLLPDNNIS